jgi:hypothetical protein
VILGVCQYFFNVSTKNRLFSRFGIFALKRDNLDYANIIPPEGRRIPESAISRRKKGDD